MYGQHANDCKSCVSLTVYPPNFFLRFSLLMTHTLLQLELEQDKRENKHAQYVHRVKHFEQQIQIFFINTHLSTEYRLISKKGEGTFSEVLKAQSIKTGEFSFEACRSFVACVLL